MPTPSPHRAFAVAIVLAMCALPLALSTVASAQQAGDPPAGAGAAEAEEGAVTTSEGEVEVSGQPADERIAERLTEILKATQRIEALEVEVREGVVFLAGSVGDTDDRDLAAGIARRLEGVVAVVNNIAIDPGPVWTLEPAQNELMALWRQIVASTPLVLVGGLALAITLALAGGATRLISGLFERFTDSELLRGVIRKAVFVVIVLVGLYVALRISGLTRVAITVVSGTGIIGLVLGFAFRDIAENFLASLLLSIQRPFHLGDVIEVDGHTGVVRKVTSRGTLLIDFDGNHIQIANATVYTSTIRNFTANPKVRLTFTVGIGYDDDIARAQAIVHDVLERHPAVLEDPKPLVLAEELGSASIVLRVYFWIDGHEHSMLKMKSSVIRLAFDELDAQGVSMPDEAREVIFPQGVPVSLPGGGEGGGEGAGMGDGDGGASADAGARQAPSTPPQHERPTHASSGQLATEAEGDLDAERQDLERQADDARDPEEGSNVLGDGADAAAQGEPKNEPERAKA